MPLTSSLTRPLYLKGRCLQQGRCLEHFCAAPSTVQPSAEQLPPCAPYHSYETTWHCKALLKQKAKEIPQQKLWLIKESKPPNWSNTEKPVLRKRATCEGQECWKGLADRETRAQWLCHTSCLSVCSAPHKHKLQQPTCQGRDC